MKYYPENDNSLYYVEFERGERKNEFTIFRRQFLYSEEEWKRYMEEMPNDFSKSLLSREVHPWNIFTSSHGPDGCVPDRKWVCWMVDALNEKVKNDESKCFGDGW